MSFRTCFRSASLLALYACAFAGAQSTTITVTQRVQHTGVKRFGVNLSGQTFYDSGQMANNLLMRNPGFEGGTWQTILRCKHFGASSCSDENPYTVWPDHFLDSAHVQVLSGPATGANSVVRQSIAAAPPLGYVLHFDTLDRTPSDGDFLLARVDKPGDATAGWWTSFACGANAVAETHDLPPGSPSRQALRVDASRPCQRADISSYFDSFETHSFVHLKGRYTLSFRAKAMGGSNRVHVTVQRLDPKHGVANFLDKVISLEPGWRSYSVPVDANDIPEALGAVRVSLVFEGASALLDDVSFAAPQSGPGAALRADVLRSLRDLHPGILRFMDNGINFGTSLEDMVAPQFRRQRTGYSTQEKLREDIAFGLPEILSLAEAIGAEPWISLPPGFSPFEMQELMEYLGGPPQSVWGSKRATAGRAIPWTKVFPRMHFELGNEQWNSVSFSGGAIHDPVAYGQRAASVFRAARKSPYFDSARFDLIAGSWFSVPWWTEQEAIALGGAADTLAVAPYLFSEFNDGSDMSAVFGAMLAQPEELSTGNGGMVKQRDALAKSAAGKRLSVYEVNLGTATGSTTVSQEAIDHVVPSLGGGLAVVNHMLLMLRELGITDQCLFALPEYQNGFTSAGGPKRTTPLWGAVVDMGGSSDARRPTFLALQAANEAMLGTMVATDIQGANPVWDQPRSENDKIAAAKTHLIQSFAFADGQKRSLIVFNLSRDRALPVNFAGMHPAKGSMKSTLLTSERIDDNNEAGEHVRLRNVAESTFQAETQRLLPPFSMSVFTWIE